MSVRAQIFVEGIADVKFLEDYLTFLGISDITVSNTMNGKDGILKLRPPFEFNLGSGIKNTLIIDADADFQKRKEELESIELLKQYEVASFLFPNNQDSGDLEILLEQIINPKNAVIFDCWNGYEACLNEKDGALTPTGKYTTPDRKAKIFAYLGALSVESDEQKEKQRNYLNTNHWDLNADYLNPLKEFIQKI
jgi:hypothetical protein